MDCDSCDGRISWTYVYETTCKPNISIIQKFSTVYHVTIIILACQICACMDGDEEEESDYEYVYEYDHTYTYKEDEATSGLKRDGW